MQQPQPMAQPFSTLMHQIETGAVKIPQFQRNFVWNRHQSAKLLDSLLKGYPIGTFIVWRTKEELRSIRNLGNVELPPTPKGDYIHYVLDGQQRMTSLFATVKGLEMERDNRVDDFSQVCIDLDADEDRDRVITDVTGKEPQTYISVRDLLSAEFVALARYPEKYHSKMQQYKSTLEGYSFSVIVVPEAPIDVATEIFTRINVSGTPLSVFEIMVAKTYSAELNFDLGEQTASLLDDLDDVGFGTIPDIVVLQTVAAIMVKECSKKEILKLDKEGFIDTWPRAVDAIKNTVDFFRSYFKIPASQLLPYKALVVPFAYFFSIHQNKPSGDIQKYLVDFFWRVSLGGHYSQSLETRLAQDIRRIDTIIKGNLPKYDYPINTTKDFIMENGWFNTGRSFIKAILCLLASQRPRSFLDNSEVFVSNDWLKRANSRNYHHFFPRAYLKRQGEEEYWSNHIGNITLVDDYLNKRRIRDKRPSDYMKEFLRQNSELTETMKTHLINVDRFGVWDDDYDRFIGARCGRFARALSSRIIYQEVDDLRQVPSDDDLEELEVTEREAVRNQD
ncbi:MAG: DUF262 domain-containing protein [Chloroflexi bacterium]|nr:DUF262 domain-containing protein [Chloroflexota bacterium]